MADFDPPHANSNETRRFPSYDEAENGFDCGPADRDRFNGQLYRLEAELGEIIRWGNLSPTNDRMTQVREAIESKISPFLKSVNGDTNGGTLSVDSNGRFVLKMSNNIEWKLDIPTNAKGFTNSVTFLSSSSWTVPANITTALVTVIGGGGGGSGGRGSVAGGNSSTGHVAGGGGGAGGYGQELVTGLVPGASIPVTVGAGGNGSAFQPASDSSGSSGGTSSFSSYVSATGGGGAANQRGGRGGYGSGGNITFSLGSGEFAATQGNTNGKGGAGGGGTIGNGTGQTNGTNGVDGSIIGSGGGGASYGGGSGASGGDGKSGLVTIYY